MMLSLFDVYIYIYGYYFHHSHAMLDMLSLSNFQVHSLSTLRTPTALRGRIAGSVVNWDAADLK